MREFDPLNTLAFTVEDETAVLVDNDAAWDHVAAFLRGLHFVPKVSEDLIESVLVAALEARAIGDERSIVLHHPGKYQGRRWVPGPATTLFFWKEKGVVSYGFDRPGLVKSGQDLGDWLE